MLEVQGMKIHAAIAEVINDQECKTMKDIIDCKLPAILKDTLQ